MSICTDKAVALIGGKVLQIDTIEYRGQLWLVPNWVISADKRTMAPLRIISLQAPPGHHLGPAPLDFFRQNPMPSSLLNGVIPEGLEKVIEVLENPPLVVLNPEVNQ